VFLSSIFFVVHKQTTLPDLARKGCICGTGREKVLSQDYREPQYHITLSRAIGRRLRRICAYVLTIQALAYLGKIIIHPHASDQFRRICDARHQGRSQSAGNTAIIISLFGAPLTCRVTGLVRGFCVRCRCGLPFAEPKITSVTGSPHPER
jgi:hypothetical protein